MEGATAVQTVNTTSLPIGMVLKLERVTSRVSLTTVAKAVGVSIGHLSRIETGERTATPELLERIRAAIEDARQAA